MRQRSRVWESNSYCEVGSGGRTAPAFLMAGWGSLADGLVAAPVSCMRVDATGLNALQSVWHVRWHGAAAVAPLGFNAPVAPS